MKLNRRNFVSKALLAALGLPVLASFNNKNNNEMSNVFLHHVFSG